MFENKKNRPFTPKNGSETPHNLWIPLQNFKLNHHTFKDEINRDNNTNFIGRKNLIDKISKLLEETKNARGSYLIAGYRGSGKTSLMNHVLNKYEDGEGQEQEKIIHINVNLGHDAVLDTRHVLFNIVNLLKNKFEEYFQKERKSLWSLITLIPVLFLILFSLFFYFSEVQLKQTNLQDCTVSIQVQYSDNNAENITTENICTANNKSISFIPRITRIFSQEAKLAPIFIFTTIFLVLFVVAILLLILSLIPKCRKKLLNLFFFGKEKKEIYQLIKRIVNLHASVAYSFEKDLGAGAYRPFGFGFKNKTNMPEMKEPQIELELLSVLEQCKECGFDIIFVFDELDKISLNITERRSNQEPVDNRNSFYKLEDETLDEWVYRRKKRVDSLLGSLKTLITVGEARFFFIAGREMLDSYQSEKGSTSSLYESLFNQVFEVPSLLTDDSDQNETQLHSMIEYYVCRQLMSQELAESIYLSNLLTKEIINCLGREKEIHQFLLTLNKKDEFTTLIFRVIGQLLGNDSYTTLSSYNREDFVKEEKKLIAEISRQDECTEKMFYDSIYSISFIFVSNNYKDKYLIKQRLNICDNKLDKHLYYQLNTYFLYLNKQDEVSEKDAEVVILALRQFINYLTIHSWGNIKRLTSLFESFIRPESQMDSCLNALSWLPQGKNTTYMLYLGEIERQRIAMGSNLYVMFNHHLSRHFTGADKLVVSTMAALHFCLKFHRHAFSRHQLFRMTEMMSIYRAPELNNVFETVITQTLWPYLRIVRSGMYRYRFFSWIEQEIRYIARVNDLESASYTFSLDAINDIKAHYRKTLNDVTNTYLQIGKTAKERGPSLVSEINIVLGDIYFLERAYDEAVVYYQTAVIAHHDLEEGNESEYALDCLIRYVETLLKLGNVQEYRQRFDRALVNYHKANKLVESFLQKHIDKDSNDIINNLNEGDSKWTLLKQPYWAAKFLNLKKGYVGKVNLDLPDQLYGLIAIDPHGEFRKGQLYFYLHQHDNATLAFYKSFNLVQSINLQYSAGNNEFLAYMSATTCVHLVDNWLIQKTIEATKSIKGSEDPTSIGKIIVKKVHNKLKLNEEIGSFDKLTKLNSSKINDIIVNVSEEKPLSIKNALILLLFAAKQYEKHNLYDRAAFTYLKAMSLWIVIFDMLPLNYLDDKIGKPNLRKNLTNLASSMDSWFPEVCDKALCAIMASNGYSQKQSYERFRFEDIINQLKLAEGENNLTLGEKLKSLDTSNEREEISNDVNLWHGSYLFQQLVFVRNWAYTVKRTLLEQPPCPLKSYRMPLYTTRSLICSSWTNGRELLEQARMIRRLLELIKNKERTFKYCKNIDDINFTAINNSTKVTAIGSVNFLNDFKRVFKQIKYAVKILKEIENQLGKDNSETSKSIREMVSITDKIKEYYYIIAAKGIQNFHTALYYSRILTDNNQSIMFPPPAFIHLQLWRMLYRLVEHEMPVGSGIEYAKARLIVRSKLKEYVAGDLLNRYLDLDYVYVEAIRQLKAHSTLGDVRSTSRVNIIQNKFFLNDDYEDPGFHLDWTLTQMLIPSTLMSIKWIEEDMKNLNGVGDGTTRH